MILVFAASAHAQEPQAQSPAPEQSATSEQEAPAQAPAPEQPAVIQPADPAPALPATTDQVAPAGAVSAAPAPQQVERKPWQMADSHLIVGAERLSNVGWAKDNAFQDGEKVGKVSGSEVRFLALPRVSLDFSWIGTIGVTFGYSGSSMTVDSLVTGDRTSTKAQGVLIGVRGGVLLDAGAYLSVWLRAGYQYQHAWEDPGGGSDVTKADAHSFVFDPRLVITPAAHLGISVGPYVQFDSIKDKTDYSAYIDPITLVGVQGGLSLDLYAFIGG